VTLSDRRSKNWSWSTKGDATGGVEEEMRGEGKKEGMKGGGVRTEGEKERG
jgi:hypothetical protein